MSWPTGPTDGQQPWVGGGPTAPVKRVGTAGFWIGGVLVVVGLVLIGVVAVIGVGRAAEVLRFPTVADGMGGVRVDDPGGHVVFVVEPWTIGATAGLTPSVAVSVIGPDGARVPTLGYEGSRTVTRADPSTGQRYRAMAVATFRAERSGRYELSAAGLAPGARLAVGDGVPDGFATLGLGVVGGSLAILVGLVLLIVTAVRRHRDRPTPSWTGWGPPYPGPGQPMTAYPQPGYPGGGFGPPGYPVPGYPAPGYPAPGYPAPGHPASSYPAPGHPVPGHAQPGDPAGGFAPPGGVPPTKPAPGSPSQASPWPGSGFEAR